MNTFPILRDPGRAGPTGKPRVKVAVKLLVAVVTAVLGITAIQGGLNIHNARQRDEAQEAQNLMALYNDHHHTVETLTRAASTLSLSFADRADVQDLFLAKDREGLLALLNPLFDTLKTDYGIVQLYVEDPDGVVFVRLHDPGRFGDDAHYRRAVASAIVFRETVAGIEVDPHGLGVRSVSPMFRQGELIGFVEVGLNYDQGFLESLKSRTGADYKMWVTYESAALPRLRPADDAPESPSERFFYYAGTSRTTLPISEEVYDRVLKTGEAETLFVPYSDQELAVLVAPLRGFRKDLPLGILEISTSRAEALAQVRKDRMTTLVVAGGLALVAFVIMWYLIRAAVLRPLGQLATAARRQLAGDLTARAELRTGDEFEQLGSTLNNLTEELEGMLQGLGDTVAERTQELERRSAYLEAGAEVSRVTTSILDMDELIQQSVDLIRERFGLYYVGLFLVDQAREWAVLRAGTGQAGQAMLARGHRIKVGEGMIGWCVAHAQARITLDIGEDAIRLATVELPDTRSEAALPLRSPRVWGERGQQVLGALTVQSDQPAAFDQDTIVILQTMADQLAVALDNARLFAEGQAALEAAQRAYGELSYQAWAELASNRTDWGYRYAHKSINPATGDWRPEMLQAVQAGHSLQEDGEMPALAIPLKVRDQAIGALSFRKSEGGGTWTDDEVALLETLTEQLGVALESARLYQDTQRRAAHERMINEITARIRSSVRLEAILDSAVREISRATDASYAMIDLDLSEMG